METKFNEKSKKFTVTEETKNVPQCKMILNEIKKMKQTPGWEYIVGYYALAREQLVDSGKKCTNIPEKHAVAVAKWAFLDGFDKSVFLVEEIMLKLKKTVEEEKESEVPKFDDGRDNE